MFAKMKMVPLITRNVLKGVAFGTVKAAKMIPPIVPASKATIFIELVSFMVCG